MVRARCLEVPLTLEALRRYTVARTLFAPTTPGPGYHQTRFCAGGPDSHPRTPRTELTTVRRTQMDAVLAYVQERGVVHPREVDGATLATRRPWPMNWSTWVPFCI